MAKRPSARYIIGEGEWDGKPERYLSRMPDDFQSQNPNRLYIVRDIQVNTQDLENPNHPQNTAYLDGACKGPYLDKSRHIFSLDHHDGCYRTFTLATCEQALRLTRKRVIGAVGFNIIGNDPDADTVLAAWVILNADRIADDRRFFRRVRPLISLEGNIDAHGFGYEEFTDLSEEAVDDNRERLEEIFSEEFELKAKGIWEKMDYLEYVRRTFSKLDLVYLPHQRMERKVHITSYQKINLDKDKSFISVIAPSGSTYQVEQEILKREKGNKRKCCCMLYHDGKIKYTLKLVDLVSEFHLDPVYKKLSEEERKAKISSGKIDEKYLKCDWGGSDDKGGGPPRYPNGLGTFLSYESIKGIAAEEFRHQVEENKKKKAVSSNGNGHSNGNGNGNSNGHTESNGTKSPPADPKVR